MKVMLPLYILLAKHIIPTVMATAIQRTVKLVPVKVHLASVTCSFDKIIFGASVEFFRVNSVKKKKVSF